MTDLLLDADRLLVVGLVDRAAELFRQAAEADPGSGAAIVGLANCELERGNMPGAYALALRALELDRNNSVALRLEARLSEVLATRGQPVRRPAWVLR
jgi:thioredoxin-like negative regulator of GroEL